MRTEIKTLWAFCPRDADRPLSEASPLQLPSISANTAMLQILRRVVRLEVVWAKGGMNEWQCLQLVPNKDMPPRVPIYATVHN